MIRRIKSSVSDNYSQDSASKRKGTKVPQQFTKQIRESKFNSKENPLVFKSVFKSISNNFLCDICANNVERNDTLGVKKCKHVFCTTCIVQYAIYKINVSEEVICPNDQCEEKMTQNAELFQKLPETVKVKWKQQQLWRQTVGNPNLKVCPQQTCSEGVVDMTLTPPECRKCHRKYCSECMMEQHEGKCDVNFQHHFREWKRCPQCRIFIQKQIGCNHMTCLCNYEFCFVCLQKWQSSHYQCFQELNLIFIEREGNRSESTSLLLLILLSVLFPLFILLLLAIALASIPICIAIAVIAAPCATLNQCGANICCLIALPFVIVASVIAMPFVLLHTTIIPFIRHSFLKYWNTLNLLREQI